MIKKMYNIYNMKKIRTAAVAGNPDANPPVLDVGATPRTKTIFQINSSILYVPVITLPMNNKIKFLENVKQGFKIAIS